MQKITSSVIIKTSAERAFECVSDPTDTALLRLLSIPMKVEKITRAQAGRDTVYHYSVKLPGTSQWQEHDSRNIEWDPPRRIVSEVISGPLAGMRWISEITKEGDYAVRLERTIEYTFPSEFKAMTEKSAREALERQAQEYTEGVKHILEKGK